jgi:hypothetical protein
MRDLAQLTADDFESFVGDEFNVDPEGSDPLKIVLQKVLRLGAPPRLRSPLPFTFSGPEPQC